MDIYKLKFTILQLEIFRFLCINSGKSFTARSLSRHLRVSPTAILKSIPLLKKEGLINAEKDAESGRMAIGLNNENPKTISLKRTENLRFIYESGLNEFLSKKFPNSDIILFGPYSLGGDKYDSSIDIAVSSKSKKISLAKFEEKLERKITIIFYSPKKINQSIRKSIVHGIFFQRRKS